MTKYEKNINNCVKNKFGFLFMYKHMSITVNIVSLVFFFAKNVSFK